MRRGSGAGPRFVAPEVSSAHREGICERGVFQAGTARGPPRTGAFTRHWAGSDGILECALGRARAGPERGHSRITMLCRKVAHNFPRSFFEYPSKRCNSNDANSRYEEAGGELRAKLVSVLGKRRRVEGPVHASSRQRSRPISDEYRWVTLQLNPAGHAPIREHYTS